MPVRELHQGQAIVFLTTLTCVDVRGQTDDLVLPIILSSKLWFILAFIVLPLLPLLLPLLGVLHRIQLCNWYVC